MKKLTNQQSGNLGEALALARLNSLGIAAYTSPDGAPGHDMIVVLDGVPKSVEVKTRQFLKRPTEITRWPVNMGTKGNADFFLFVELDLRTLSPNFYLLDNAQAQLAYRDNKSGGSCAPPLVRSIARQNDFSSLVSGQ